ncbi:MAG: hypothetical protein U1E27_01450 [Kiritimatiellia bacterium]|nr:hypothetical protein [Kiritimatiellia bacterium]
MVHKPGIQVLGETGVEVRRIALGSQDVDVEEPGFHDGVVPGNKSSYVVSHYGVTGVA